MKVPYSYFLGVCISPIKDDSMRILIHGVRYDSGTIHFKMERFDSEGFRFDEAQLNSRGYDAMDFLLKVDNHFIK